MEGEGGEDAPNGVTLNKYCKSSVSNNVCECLLDALALIVVRSRETYEPEPHPP